MISDNLFEISSWSLQCKTKVPQNKMIYSQFNLFLTLQFIIGFFFVLVFIDHKYWSSNHLYFKLHYPIFPMNLVLFLVFVIVLSPRHSCHITSINTGTSMLVITVAVVFNYLCFKCNLLLLCGDVELNPGPKQNIAKKIYYLPLEP